MAHAPQQQTCPNCGASVPVADAEPLARVPCPSCGEKVKVQLAFDNFEVVETLGVGGMGSVYKARDTRLDRFVALKVLRKELSTDPAEAARLEQEARVTASVNHPNVVQVYSAGNANGQIYLVMELVAHGSLDDLMAQHTRVPEAQVLDTGIQVAKGLQAAYEKGLIHRDVKPANILYLDERTAKIGDFGLAGLAEQKEEGRTEIWGTPYYVAPERLNNEPEDFRSDIYSLGATLFHAIAGVPPMEGETTSAAELHRLKMHPPPLRKLAPDVSAETARVIDRMLIPKPANRFTSYQHVIDQLERARRSLDGAGAPSRRNIWIGAGVLLLLVLAVAGYLLKTRIDPARATGPGTQPSTETSPAADTAALRQRYEQARKQIIDGKQETAAKELTRLTSDKTTPQPLLNWARLHLGLTNYLQNRATPAREAFQQVERGGLYSANKADEQLASFFLSTAQRLTATGVVRETSSGTGPQPFATLLFALKNWTLGDFAAAAQLLEQFTTSQPAGEFAWINDYKPIAQQYLTDYRTYAAARPPERFAAAAEIEPAIENLQQAQKQLKTRGALRASIGDEIKRLQTELKRREKEQQTAAEAERKKLLDAESPQWEAALATARKAAAAYDFTSAYDAVTAAKVTEPSLAEARENERQRYNALRDWKTRIALDMSSGRYRAPIQVGGVTYEGVRGASLKEIELRIPGDKGSAPFAWPRVPPDALLSISIAFAANAPDAAERQWQAALFAHSTGQAEAAKKLADAAVKAKPELKERLDLLKVDGSPRVP
jgi:eukaryotic-like serine/threonine-protein kinase